MLKGRYFAAASLLFSTLAFAWPDKPINILVAQGPAGKTDIQARTLAKIIGENLPGQKVTIQNLGGNRGWDAVEAIQKAPADGYTLLFSDSSVFANRLAGQPGGSLPEINLDFLGVVSEAPMVLLANATVDNNPGDLKKHVSTSSAPVVFGYVDGDQNQLNCAELVRNKIDSRIKITPVKTQSDLEESIKAGMISFGCSGTAQLRMGTFYPNIYGVLANTRIKSPKWSEIPTLAEKSGDRLTLANWSAFYAPKGTPTEVQNKINAIVRNAAKNKEFQDAGAGFGAELIVDARASASGHKAYFQEEMGRLAKSSPPPQGNAAPMESGPEESMKTIAKFVTGAGAGALANEADFSRFLELTDKFVDYRAALGTALGRQIRNIPASKFPQIVGQYRRVFGKDLYNIVKNITKDGCCRTSLSSSDSSVAVYLQGKAKFIFAKSERGYLLTDVEFGGTQITTARPLRSTFADGDVDKFSAALAEMGRLH